MHEADGVVRVGMDWWFRIIALLRFLSFSLVVYCVLFPPLCTKAKQGKSGLRCRHKRSTCSVPCAEMFWTATWDAVQGCRPNDADCGWCSAALWLDISPLQECGLPLLLLKLLVPHLLVVGIQTLYRVYHDVISAGMKTLTHSFYLSMVIQGRK